VVPAVLWFFIGLAINRWTQKAGAKPVPAFKIVISIAVLVLIYHAVTAVVIRLPGTDVPIAGSWITFSVTLAYLEAGSILRTVPVLPAITGLVTLPILLLVIIFIYRILCFIGQVNTRMVAVFANLFVVTILSRELAFALYGVSFNFISVRNFIGLGIGDFYNYAFYFVFFQFALFGFDKARETSPEDDVSLKAFFKAFFTYEIGNIKAVVSKLKKYCVLLCAVFLFSCSIDDTSEDRIVIPFYVDENNRIVLHATINGLEGRFLFDTGAMFSHVYGAGGRFVYGRIWPTSNEGQVHIYRVYRVRSIRFGDTEVRARSLLKGNDYYNAALDRQEGFDGLLGNGIFEGFWVEMSFSRNEIVLHREKPAHFAQSNHAPLMFWDSRHRNVWQDNRFLLYVDIDGVEFPMLIDSGAGDAFYFQNTVAYHITPAYLRRVSSIGEAGDFYLARANSISFMGRTYYDRWLATNSIVAARLGHEYAAGIMGMDFLMHYDFLFDYTNMRRGRTGGMYFKPISKPGERDYGFFPASLPTVAPELGIIDFLRKPAGRKITCIMTDSELYTIHGLRPGTVVTEINGQATRYMSFYEMHDAVFLHPVTDIAILEDGREVFIRLGNH